MPIDRPGASSPVGVPASRAYDEDLETRLTAFASLLEIDRERRRDVVDELRSHVLDAADAHRARGLDPGASIERAWADLGDPDAVAGAINAAHAGAGVLDALWVTAMPVMLALMLRWGVLTLDGRSLDWRRLALGAPFLVFAAAALIGPAVSLPRRRFAVGAWIVFWSLSVLTLAAP